MPSYTIPLTPKQKASLDAVDAQIRTLQGNTNIYVQAIVQGQPEAPSDKATLKLTADGIEITEPDAVTETPPETPPETAADA